MFRSFRSFRSSKIVDNRYYVHVLIVLFSFWVPCALAVLQHHRARNTIIPDVINWRTRFCNLLVLLQCMSKVLGWKRSYRYLLSRVVVVRLLGSLVGKSFVRRPQASWTARLFRCNKVFLYKKTLFLRPAKLEVVVVASGIFGYLWTGSLIALHGFLRLTI